MNGYTVQSAHADISSLLTFVGKKLALIELCLTCPNLFWNAKKFNLKRIDRNGFQLRTNIWHDVDGSPLTTMR